MKTNNSYLISKHVSLCLLVFMVTFCKKETVDTQPIANSNENVINFKSIGWEVTFSAGHNWIDCAGTCFSTGIPYDPVIHMPCWSFGKKCKHTIGLSILKSSDLFNKERLDEPFDMEVILKGETIESDFQFPDRSFSYTKDNVQYWLNIPKQNVKTKDNRNSLFMLRKIYLSTKKAFDNK